MAASAAPVFQIVYTAVSAFDLDASEVEDMVARSGKLRRRLGVTGLFGYLPRTGEMFEVLEGKREHVEAAFKAAKSDAQRIAISVRYEGSAERRQFGRWMPCLNGIDALEALGHVADVEAGSIFPPPARVVMELAAAHF
jgi:hypothetical protein